MLIVEPMGVGLELITAAREQGFEVLVASFDGDDRRLPYEALRQVDALFVVDTNDEAALTQLAIELHEWRPLSGILPGSESYVDSVARLAARLGIEKASGLG